MASNQYESSNDAEGMMPMETFSHTKKSISEMIFGKNCEIAPRQKHHKISFLPSRDQTLLTVQPTQIKNTSNSYFLKKYAAYCTQPLSVVSYAELEN